LKSKKTRLKKQPITVYGETTPNPPLLKFVVSRMLTKKSIEFKNRSNCSSHWQENCLNFIRERNFIENYISVTKYDEQLGRDNIGISSFNSTLKMGNRA
jgi:hypothetical protein